jgi:GNAT superfamily N-acetyltransferase
MDIVSQAKKYLKSLGIDQWQNEYPRREDYSDDIEKKNCWLFICEGEPAGVITVSMDPESCYNKLEEGKWPDAGSPFGAFQRLAVRENYRHTGLATEMVSFAEDLCLGTGKKGMRAATHKDNYPIQNLLKKRGYSLCGTLLLTSGPDRGKTRLAFERL